MDDLNFSDVTREWLQDPPKDRVISLPLTKEVIAVVLKRMQITKTTDAYDTKDTISRKTNLLNCSTEDPKFKDFNWTEVQEWNQFLNAVASQFDCDRKMLNLLSVSLFIKRGRGFEIAFISSISSKMSAWVCVKLLDAPPTPLFPEDAEINEGRERCFICKMPNVSNRCNACKQFFYCGKKCQKHHWKSSHKAECWKHHPSIDAAHSQ